MDMIANAGEVSQTAAYVEGTRLRRSATGLHAQASGATVEQSWRAPATNDRFYFGPDLRASGERLTGLRSLVS